MEEKLIKKLQGATQTDADRETHKIDSKFISGLAELFIKEPPSLELLLMLADEGPKTVEKISREIIYDTKITGLLDKLDEFKVINIENGWVNITDDGYWLVKKLREKVRERNDKAKGMRKYEE